MKRLNVAIRWHEHHKAECPLRHFEVATQKVPVALAIKHEIVDTSGTAIESRKRNMPFPTHKDDLDTAEETKRAKILIPTNIQGPSQVAKNKADGQIEPEWGTTRRTEHRGKRPEDLVQHHQAFIPQAKQLDGWSNTEERRCGNTSERL